jgi:hypothetical protein
MFSRVCASPPRQLVRFCAQPARAQLTAAAELSGSFVRNFTEQIAVLLPGGVGVLGVYQYCASAPETQATLRQLLFSVCGALI